MVVQVKKLNDDHIHTSKPQHIVKGTFEVRWSIPRFQDFFPHKSIRSPNIAACGSEWTLQLESSEVTGNVSIFLQCDDIESANKQESLRSLSFRTQLGGASDSTIDVTSTEGNDGTVCNRGSFIVDDHVTSLSTYEASGAHDFTTVTNLQEKYPSMLQADGTLLLLMRVDMYHECGVEQKPNGVPSFVSPSTQSFSQPLAHKVRGSLTKGCKKMKSVTKRTQSPMKSDELLFKKRTTVAVRNGDGFWLAQTLEPILIESTRVQVQWYDQDGVTNTWRLTKATDSISTKSIHRECSFTMSKQGKSTAYQIANYGKFKGLNSHSHYKNLELSFA